MPRRPRTANRAAEAAAAAAKAAKAADAAADAAQDALKAAKAEVKNTANAETVAKKAVEAFDRREANRSHPVSVFVSSATGMVHIRQGFERIIDAQATIENPDVPLDTFVFTALDWQDDSKTGLKWSATEVNEYSTRMSSLDLDEGSGRNKKRSCASGCSPARLGRREGQAHARPDQAPEGGQRPHC